MKTIYKIEILAGEIKRAKDESKYYIDYVSKNTIGANFYYQLVRRSDEAILCANHRLENVFAHCFTKGIRAEDAIIL
jgi:hypothetical protein